MNAQSQKDKKRPKKRIRTVSIPGEATIMPEGVVKKIACVNELIDRLFHSLCELNDNLRPISQQPGVGLQEIRDYKAESAIEVGTSRVSSDLETVIQNLTILDANVVNISSTLDLGQ